MYEVYKNALVQNGYRPIPIVPNAKNPAVEDWVTLQDAPDGYAGCGVGIRTGTDVIALDIDVFDPDTSKLMCDIVTAKYPGALCRVGNAPKKLFVMRSEPGLRKMKSNMYENCGAVEVLGWGQQFVAHGIHPDTQQPYHWEGIMGGIESVPTDVLPFVSPAELTAFLDAFERIAQRRGFRASENRRTQTDRGLDFTDPLLEKNRIGLSMEDIRKILSYLDPDCGRDGWIRLGMAVHHETQGDLEGFALWDAWSSRGRKYHDGEPEKMWTSFARGYSGEPATGAYLVKSYTGITGSLVGLSIDRATPSASAPANPMSFFDSLNWSTDRFVDEPGDIPMVVENMLPQGVVSMLFSAGGAGKSTVLMHICSHIAMGLPVFGNKSTPGTVVILTAEDPELILNHRFMGVVNAIAADTVATPQGVRRRLSSKFKIISTFGHTVQLFSIPDQTTIVPTMYYQSLIEALHRIPDLRLVVVDTKTRYSPGEGKGNVLATQEIGYYEGIAHRTGASVMLLHHTSKAARNTAGGVDSAQAFRDASALYDSVRAAWYLRPPRPKELERIGDGEDCIVIENVKNNYVKMHHPLLLRRAGYSFNFIGEVKEVTDDERETSALNGILQVLLTALQTQAELFRLCKNIGLGRTKANQLIKDMIDDNLISVVPDGKRHVYSITEVGVARFNS